MGSSAPRASGFPTGLPWHNEELIGGVKELLEQLVLGPGSWDPASIFDLFQSVLVQMFTADHGFGGALGDTVHQFLLCSALEGPDSFVSASVVGQRISHLKYLARVVICAELHVAHEIYGQQKHPHQQPDCFSREAPEQDLLIRLVGPQGPLREASSTSFGRLCAISHPVAAAVLHEEHMPTIQFPGKGFASMLYKGREIRLSVISKEVKGLARIVLGQLQELKFGYSNDKLGYDLPAHIVDDNARSIQWPAMLIYHRWTALS
jgi:hypothetical protein